MNSTTRRDRFQSRGELGRGGMAIVHRVFDHTIGRTIAVKSLPTNAAPADRAAFANEVRTLGRLEHPNIVPVYDVEDGPFGTPERFSMKLLEGETLAERLARCDAPPRGQPLEDLLRIVTRICDAVAFAHDRDVLHLDLKPGNIFLGDHGQVYVTDWGLAIDLRRHGGAAATRTPTSNAAPSLRRTVSVEAADATMIEGTPAYMAPEQARGERRAIDVRTDVYGIGGIVYEILTLRAPRNGNSLVEVLTTACTEPVADPEAVLPGGTVPHGLARIAMKALAMRSEDRYETVGQLQNALEEFVRGGGWFPCRRFSAGSLVIREGERDDCAYILQAGRCAVYRGYGARRIALREVGPGEVIGEVALLSRAERLASVEALTDVEVLVVSRAALDLEVARSDWLAALLGSIAARFAESDRLVAKLTADALAAPAPRGRVP